MLSAVTARHNAKLVDPMSALRRDAAAAVDGAVARGLRKTRFELPWGTDQVHADLLAEELRALGYVAAHDRDRGQFFMIVAWVNGGRNESA